MKPRVRRVTLGAAALVAFFAVVLCSHSPQIFADTDEERCVQTLTNRLLAVSEDEALQMTAVLLGSRSAPVLTQAGFDALMNRPPRPAPAPPARTLPCEEPTAHEAPGIAYGLADFGPEALGYVRESLTRASAGHRVALERVLAASIGPVWEMDAAFLPRLSRTPGFSKAASWLDDQRPEIRRGALSSISLAALIPYMGLAGAHKLPRKDLEADLREALPALEKARDDADASVRGRAEIATWLARALTERRSEPTHGNLASERLVPSLDDADPFLRQGAALFLYVRGTEEQRNRAAIVLIETFHEGWLGGRQVTGVLRTRPGSAVTAATGCTESRDDCVRRNAAVALAILADREVGEAAAALLQLPVEVRKHGVDALGEMKPWREVGLDIRTSIDAGTAALIDALEDPRAAVPASICR